MKTIAFKCTLISDVVFNLKTATEGNQKTLDYIPGSAIYGLVAGKFYEELMNENGLDVFHRGGIIFNDAHPLLHNMRAYRTPAWWYNKKGSGLNEGIYSPYYKAKPGEPQLKQCRGGYISMLENGKFTDYSPVRRFSIKSAYDSKMRRAEESQMFGYQSLNKDTEWIFEMCYDESFHSEAQIIKDFLVGVKPLGKSKSAEYGLVNIEIASPDAIQISTNTREDFCLLYADSRLAFFDEYVQPTYLPTPDQLGISNGEIMWDVSQIRTMQYAPFNGKRKTRDTERFCIEKGSVFCVRKKENFSVRFNGPIGYVGHFTSEGFGRLIVDPVFLNFDIEGKIPLEYIEDPDRSVRIINKEPVKLSHFDDLVFKYLEQQNNLEEQNEIVLKKVNDFVKANLAKFKGEKFSSQWGTIRSIANTSATKQELVNALFNVADEEGINHGYLVHGIAADKWKERGRIHSLKHFINDNEINDGNLVLAVINLASQMAKACRKEENHG